MLISSIHPHMYSKKFNEIFIVVNKDVYSCSEIHFVHKFENEHYMNIISVAH